MKFVDEVRIFVKAGDGGHGAVAFRREKFIERGGPSGGDGGNGGSVIFVADPQLTTLLDFRYQQHHRAKNGENGMGSDCNGRASDDLILKVPSGTLIREADSGELLADLSEPGQQYVAAQGGRGGLGNMNFATSTRQTPRFAQEGTKGEERTLILELKLLADVGLLGFPNAGKSTLISRVSRARPKIADYPFTTLVPNLGMIQYKDNLSFVMADIPGLIEGASEGVGLGHQFLRHVERCKVLIHLIDLGAEGEGRDPVKDYDILNRELEKYSAELSKKPQVVAPNKVDITEARERLEKFTAAMRKRGVAVFPVSTATGEGLQALLDVTAEVLFTGRTGKLQVERPEKPAKKAPAKKVSAAKQPAKKAAVKKAPAKKAAAKKAPAKKAPAKKALAKKGAAKKAPAKKAAAKKAAAKKAPARGKTGARAKTVAKAGRRS
ncbi:GTPase ObgE [Hyalangium minutum]|uniref:GTPase Obg n=1 Tax=Hyalangium minutum TaxID=394096 RepID=A0A085WJ58_9BACT|nr:GTPase ObgE [Hyalangium minutum]KFE67721.1 GTP-binding protein Obg [Hyalangium minutum]